MLQIPIFTRYKKDNLKTRSESEFEGCSQYTVIYGEVLILYADVS